MAANSAAHPAIITHQIGGQQLAGACHNAAQRAVLALPGQDVQAIASMVTHERVNTGRPSYINALLIQSCGTPRHIRCSECFKRGPTPLIGAIRR